MTQVVRQATVRWLSHPPGGRARISVTSRAFTELAMSVPDEPEPRPEEAAPGELLAAGYTSILAVDVAERLKSAGHAADELVLEGACTLESDHPGSHRLTRLSFSLHARVPSLDAPGLDQAARHSLRDLRQDMGLQDGVALEIGSTLEGTGRARGAGPD